MKLIVQEAFNWAHRHVDIKEYAVGDEIETDDIDLITVAIAEGWVEEAASGQAPENKAKKSAPEKKST